MFFFFFFQSETSDDEVEQVPAHKIKTTSGSKGKGEKNKDLKRWRYMNDFANLVETTNKCNKEKLSKKQQKKRGRKSKIANDSLFEGDIAARNTMIWNGLSLGRELG